MPGINPRPSNQQRYDEESLQKALHEILSGKSVRKVSKESGIPYTTLYEKSRGQSKAQVCKRGTSCLLGEEVEKELAKKLINVGSFGYGRTREDVTDLTKQYLDLTGRTIPQFKNNRPGKTWWYGFLRRNNNLIKTSSPTALELSRAMSCTETSVRAWFTEFTKTLKSLGINRPDQIYNADETGCQLSTVSKTKLVFGKFTKRPYRVTENNKDSITSLHCICADGTKLPPAVLFKGERFPFGKASKFPDNAHIGVTKNGWMEQDQFLGWLKHSFIPNLRPIRPVLLLVDGHVSHIDLRAIDLCMENQIHLYLLHEHASHIIQPCDAQFFKEFKKNLKEESSAFRNQNPSLEITPHTSFGEVFMNALNKISPQHVINSFKSTGIWPLDPDVVDYSKCAPSEAFVEPPAAMTSIAQVSNSLPTSSSFSLSSSSSPSTSLVPTSSTSILQPSSLSTSSSSFSSSSSSSFPSISPSPNLSTSVLQPTSLPTSLSSSSSSSFSPSISLTPTLSTSISHEITTPSIEKKKAGILASLEALEGTVTKNDLALFARRRHFNEEAPDDPVYHSWKILKDSLDNCVNVLEEIEREVARKSDQIATKFEYLMPTPTITRKGKTVHKRIIPKHLSSEAAVVVLEIERSEKLAKEAEKLVRADQKINADQYCQSCKKKYEEEEEWIMCDKCEKWYHFACTDIDTSFEDIKEKQWFCCRKRKAASSRGRGRGRGKCKKK